MNKFNNPRLLNTVISGTGMKHPVRPHVIIGSEEKGFIRGDLMDANAIAESVEAEINERMSADSQLSQDIDTKINQAVENLVNGAPEVLDTLKELSDALGNNENFATSIATELSSKVDKVEGKGLSTNDYTNAEKTKLSELLDVFDRGTGETSVVLKGTSSIASGAKSIAVGLNTTASGANSHAEGNNTIASGVNAHAEGAGGTEARGEHSHAEGWNNLSSGDKSHSEGEKNTASGVNSHVGGFESTASGKCSFAHGYRANASGENSISLGTATLATKDGEMAVGRFNISNSHTRFSVGVGTADNNRKNAFAVTDEGKVLMSIGSSDNVDLGNIVKNINVSVNTLDRTINKPLTEDLTNGHDYVEIGGVKWATMNVGAKSVTDYGLYFQWGDTKGYSAEDVENGVKEFSLSDCKYYNGSSYTKYNNDRSDTLHYDSKTRLELCDDGVNANWGSNWRMPTIDEITALYDAVNISWTSDYQGSGVAGLICTDKTDSSKVLFFPAAGMYSNGSAGSIGTAGYYWSSDGEPLSTMHNACNLYFYDGLICDSDDMRIFGYSLRGVYDSDNITKETTLLKKAEDDIIFCNNVITKSIINVYTNKNAASDITAISSNHVVAYTEGNTNYLVLGMGHYVNSNTVITKAELIGTSFYCPVSIMVDNNNVLIYPSLPYDNIKDDIKYLVLYYYNIMPYKGPRYCMWIDDYSLGGFESLDELASSYSEGGYNTFANYAASIVANPAEAGCGDYYFNGETFIWNGETYYLWEKGDIGNVNINVNKVAYMLTDTIDYMTLYRKSLQFFYSNNNSPVSDSEVIQCPYVAMLTTDMEIYKSANNLDGDTLVKIEIL